MGNHAIFTVLGLMVFFGMVSTTLNTNEAQSTKNVSAFVTNDVARDIAYDALNLARLNVDTGLANMNISSFPLRGSLLGGTYSVTATAITSAGGDTVQLSSTGTYEGTSYTVQTTLFHNVKCLPPSYKAALRLRASGTLWAYSGSATTLVDGRDHNNDSSCSLTQSRATDMPDISVLTSKDSVNVSSGMTYNYVKDFQTLAVDPVINFSTSYIDTLIAYARIWGSVYQTSGATVLSVPSSTWGSSTNPTIVVVDASNCYYSKLDGQYTGTGILILRGDAWVSGTLRWNGLVISYTTAGDPYWAILDSKTNSWVMLSGNTTILGAFMLVGMNTSYGNGTEFKMLGTSQVLYSSSTLRAVTNMPKLNKYFVNTVSQWYE